jgi:hypothetical protein
MRWQRGGLQGWARERAMRSFFRFFMGEIQESQKPARTGFLGFTGFYRLVKRRRLRIWWAAHPIAHPIGPADGPILTVHINDPDGIVGRVVERLEFAQDRQRFKLSLGHFQD